MYYSSKTYGHEIGLSCCFRQWKAKSHCAQLHGYALAVHIEFQATHLNESNWVVDFGGLSGVKQFLQANFDHKLIVAQDDPEMTILLQLAVKGIAALTILPQVGCEAFAQHICEKVTGWLQATANYPRVRVAWVEVREHGANAARFVQPFLMPVDPFLQTRATDDLRIGECVDTAGEIKSGNVTSNWGDENVGQ